MQLHLIVVVVVVFAVAICDGQTPPPGGNGPAVAVAGKAGSDKCLPDVHQDLFNPCVGRFFVHPCVSSEVKELKYPVYEKRLVHAGKWLKVKQRQFNQTLGDYQPFTHFVDYINRNKHYTLPYVMRIDVPVEQTRIYKRILSELRDQVNKSYQAAITAPDSRSASAVFNSKSIAANTEIHNAYLNYSKNFQVTAYNYLNGRYQINPKTKNATEDPPAPTDPNVSIVMLPDMMFYVKGYLYRGIRGCPNAVLELGECVNQTEPSTFYFATYSNNIFEVWLPVDPAKKLNV